MYTLEAIVIGKNLYAVPTSAEYQGCTYCYIFEGNDFNWDVTYSCVKFISDEKLRKCNVIRDVIEIGDSQVKELTSLNYWNDIKDYFEEF